jgi:hypothetical protein
MSVSSEIEVTRSFGEQLKALIKSDRAKLDPRVPPGCIDGMIADLPLLRSDALDAVDARQARLAATKGQGNAASVLYELVMAARFSCKLSKLDSEVLSRMGVGKPMQTKVVKSVLQGAQLVVQAYAQFPDQMRLAGLLPADMDRIQALTAQLTTADDVQEATKLTSKEKTAARNAAHKRVKNAIATIIGAADLAFLDNPERRALYRALLPTKRSAGKPAPTPEA